MGPSTLTTRPGQDIRLQLVEPRLMANPKALGQALVDLLIFNLAKVKGKREGVKLWMKSTHCVRVDHYQRLWQSGARAKLPPLFCALCLKV